MYSCIYISIHIYDGHVAHYSCEFSTPNALSNYSTQRRITVV